MQDLRNPDTKAKVGAQLEKTEHYAGSKNL